MSHLKYVAFGLLLLMLGMIWGCSSSGDTGVCTGYSSILERTYCYGNFTEDECGERDQQQVNGANWYFYEGQTCDDRGLNEGSN